MTNWETQRRHISDTEASTVAAFCAALGATLAVVAATEIVAGTTELGLIVLLVSLGLLLLRVRVRSHRTAPEVGALILSVILLVAAIVLLVGSGGRAVGVLIFVPVMVACFVLLLDRWPRYLSIAIAVLLVPLAGRLSQSDLDFPLIPEPAWVATAIYRVTLLASIATLLVGMSYRLVMNHYRSSSRVALDNWRDEAAAGHQAAARLREFADACADVLWETDDKLRFTYFSDGFDSVFGVHPSAVLGMTPAEAYREFSGFDRDVESFMRPLRAQEKIARQMLRWATDGDRVKRIEYSAKPYLSQDGRFAGYRGVMNDVTEEFNTRRALEFQATHDQLSRLLNRQSFLDSMGRRLVACAARADAAAVAFIDLDDFKRLNDAAGHELGDDLLVRVADILHRLTAADHLSAARLGGDEFAVFGEGIDGSQMLEVGEAFLDELKGLQVVARGQALGVSASVGVHGEAPVREVDPASWLRQADGSAYLVKERGRSGVQLSETRPGGTADSTEPS